MQFNRIRVMIDVSLTSKTPITCFEHEIPILQAIRGSGKVEPIDPTPECGPAKDAKGNVIDFNLDEEWSRLMGKAKPVQQGESGQKTPAPLIAFPNGVRDLEYFYENIRKPKSVDEKPVVEPLAAAAPPQVNVTQVDPKELRRITRARLDELGIEYKGNASTDDLVALLDEVADAGLQNQG